jgi:outer membrane lipoprotein carrier protein
MKAKITLISFFTLFLAMSAPVFCQDKTPPAKETPPTLDELISKIENRYAGEGFSARFDQRSSLKAMDITDTASGKVLIKRPGMMRWEYDAPDRQTIITDGKILWIYRPDDHQVMMGKAPAYLGDGKGASFLSDIRLVRKNFDVTLEDMDEPCCHTLKLVPKKKQHDMAFVYLLISKHTSEVLQIVTYNSYGDQTIIDLSEFQFRQKFDDATFSFTPPQGTDILQLDE